MKRISAFLLMFLLNGCAVLQKTDVVDYKPEVVKNTLQKEFDAVLPPAGPKITAAVYSFKDLTGQRRTVPNIASFSTAVTQGAEPLLIKALSEVGHGSWFDVVERVNIDNLIKERTIIKQMRDAYEGKAAQQLPPIQFAGIIMEGGIIGYDSSTESGGAAYRYLGIGPQTQYSKDSVTISLRAVSVATGKVLVSVTVNKIVYSTADSIAVLKFWNNGTQEFESEAGLTINESSTSAVKAAIEASVVELIKEGTAKGIWQFKIENKGTMP
jgi:curli production assembly/transport component CsgG